MGQMVHAFKNSGRALAGVVQLVGVILCTEGLPVQFQVRAHDQVTGTGSIPGEGCAGGNWLMF